ncbi:hypothetical protein [Xenorhabdus griffiniae]|nr:hypothetical protein [Xenorhabdus griffiniae]MBD1227405.1 hypothetical protein [Xenorhabdus griffiniae]MBE8589448.1 hypothetical protein [Xenorhabdus griffiniae]
MITCILPWRIYEHFGGVDITQTASLIAISYKLLDEPTRVKSVARH